MKPILVDESCEKRVSGRVNRNVVSLPPAPDGKVVVLVLNVGKTLVELRLMNMQICNGSIKPVCVDESPGDTQYPVIRKVVLGLSVELVRSKRQGVAVAPLLVLIAPGREAIIQLPDGSCMNSGA